MTGSRPSAATPKGARTREALLASVIALVDAGGLEAVSYRAVGAHAGISAALISYHFDSLEAMVEEAMENFVTQQISNLQALMDDPPTGSLEETVRAIVALLWEQRAGARVQFSLYLAAAERPAFAAAARRCVAAYEQFAVAALTGLGVPDAAARAPAAVALIDGMALRRPSLERAEIEEATTNAVLLLFGPEAAPAHARADARVLR